MISNIYKALFGSNRGSFFATVSLRLDDTETVFSNKDALFVETDMVHCFNENTKAKFLSVSNRYLCPNQLFLSLTVSKNQIYLDLLDFFMSEQKK